MSCSPNIICMKNLPSQHFFFFTSYVAVQFLMDRMCHLVQCSGQEACFWRWGFVPESQGTGDWKVKARDLATLFMLTTETWQGHAIHKGEKMYLDKNLYWTQLLWWRSTNNMWNFCCCFYSNQHYLCFMSSWNLSSEICVFFWHFNKPLTFFKSYMAAVMISSWLVN